MVILLRVLFKFFMTRYILVTLNFTYDLKLWDILILSYVVYLLFVQYYFTNMYDLKLCDVFIFCAVLLFYQHAPIIFKVGDIYVVFVLLLFYRFYISLYVYV